MLKVGVGSEAVVPLLFRGASGKRPPPGFADAKGEPGHRHPRSESASATQHDD